MKTCNAASLAILLSALCSAAFAYQPGDPIPEKRIAVMNLKVSGDYSEQVQDWLPALIEDQLLKQGWTLVVRGERMQHVQDERSLPGVREGTRPPDNEILGATAFVELAARVQVKDIQGAIGFKYFTLGDYARASIDLTGQIVDPSTGVLKSSLTVGGSASGLKTAAVVTIGSDWRIGAGGYNINGVRKSLVGKAADQAACKLVEKLKTMYPSIPGQIVPGQSYSGPVQPASTTVAAAPATSTMLIELPDAASARSGDRYGIYRADVMVAEVEIIRLAGKRAEAKVITQSSAILGSDVARKMPVVIKAE